MPEEVRISYTYDLCSLFCRDCERRAVGEKAGKSYCNYHKPRQRTATKNLQWQRELLGHGNKIGGPGYTRFQGETRNRSKSGKKGQR